MTFADLPAGASIFLDANPLVYHGEAHRVIALGSTPSSSDCPYLPT